jgi:hypothetical protein
MGDHVRLLLDVSFSVDGKPSVLFVLGYRNGGSAATLVSCQAPASAVLSAAPWVSG